jgi:hypothetical protein
VPYSKNIEPSGNGTVPHLTCSVPCNLDIFSGHRAVAIKLSGYGTCPWLPSYATSQKIRVLLKETANVGSIEKEERQIVDAATLETIREANRQGRQAQLALEPEVQEALDGWFAMSHWREAALVELIERVTEIDVEALPSFYFRLPLL